MDASQGVGGDDETTGDRARVSRKLWGVTARPEGAVSQCTNLMAVFGPGFERDYVTMVNFSREPLKPPLEGHTFNWIYSFTTQVNTQSEHRHAARNGHQLPSARTSKSDHKVRGDEAAKRHEASSLAAVRSDERSDLRGIRL
ncbi:hypothetical protein AAFF_G00410520 [Aldrovandia affinis]|uniref:Uncharacterized protein n=1 Tax=Aldrovandia affinis TaxID=143900 RepID=A0AAD7WJS6_9TELE|nr:hypothetical protein AAFF_G00410520 [Aldrovandia affinis]